MVTRMPANHVNRRTFVTGLGVGLLLGSRPGRGAAQCQSVELFPGYPGYRGYVTGVDGIGDFACVEDLVAADPAFDPVVQDGENQAAAQLLGLDGEPVDWTWENWMAIEAERGLWPTCYSCAIGDAADRAEPVNPLVAPDDPRLLLGGYRTTYALSRLGEIHNVALPDPNGFGIQFDHHLRALVGMANPGHWNARQVLMGYDGVVDFLFSSQYINMEFVWGNLIAQGGYAPTPSTAMDDDQIAMIAWGGEALFPFMSSDARDVTARNVEAGIQGWRLARYNDPAAPSFAEFLRENGAADWF